MLLVGLVFRRLIDGFRVWLRLGLEGTNGNFCLYVLLVGRVINPVRFMNKFYSLITTLICYGDVTLKNISCTAPDTNLKGSYDMMRS